ncbi:MAG: PLD nuclease N-terminal domain-containing protein [Lacisediminihabitans sp.]
MYLLVSFLFVALFVGALVDIIMRDQSLIRHLPKLVWILVVILLPSIGSILWFALGREYTRPASKQGVINLRHREAPVPPTVSMPGSYGMRNTEAELAALDREIEAHTKAERIRQLEAELEARRSRGAED